MHAAQIYAELLGQVCHKAQFLGNLNGKQEVLSDNLSPFPNETMTIPEYPNSRHSYSMPDTARFTSSMLRSPILIYMTSPVMEPITNFESQIPPSSQLNIPNHLECVSQPIRRTFSGYLRMYCVIWSPEITMSNIFPRMNGIHIGVRRLVWK